MSLEKGSWKHCWVGTGDPFEVRGSDGKRRYDRNYVCRTCGARIVARCSAKIKTNTWKKLGVLPCSEELVRQIHSL